MMSYEMAQNDRIHFLMQETNTSEHEQGDERI
jgi:hypothetical protein